VTTDQGPETKQPETKHIVCLVGTDHHAFDRVIAWCDALAARDDVTVFVQYGQSKPPSVAAGRDFLGHDELLAELGRAHVAITHGGPGLINDVQSAGLWPIVVPRDPERDEHVDGHQQRFSRRLGAEGVVFLAEDESTFTGEVDRQLAAPRGASASGEDRAARVTASVHEFGRLVDELLAGRG
jgi:UDP-N-acetylglucosamine transferase subunit ALG13